MLTTRVKTGGLLLLALLLSALAFYFLGDDGFFAAQFSSEETGAMFLEIGVLFLLLFVAARRVKSCQRGIANALICVTFAARHLALFSVLIAGLWLAALALIGRELLGDRERLTAERAGRGFVLGAAAWIVLVGLLSALHLGGTRLWRILALLFCGAAFLPPLFRYAKEKGFAFSYHCTIRRETRTESVLSAATVTAVLVQLGRMNIAIDYDSLRYALRSPFVLDNGRGIFESLGSVNQVYFYPKGLEILALPLYTEHSFGPVLAFSFCLGIGLLWLLFDLGRALLGTEGAKRLVFTAALIPGVMNLSISAKTDLITVLFQLIAVRELLTAEQSSGRARTEALAFAASAVLFTLMLKPTAIVFSGGLVFAALLYTAVFRPRLGRENAAGEERNETEGKNLRGLILTLPAGIGLHRRLRGARFSRQVPARGTHPAECGRVPEPAGARGGTCTPPLSPLPRTDRRRGTAHTHCLGDHLDSGTPCGAFAPRKEAGCGTKERRACGGAVRLSPRGAGGLTPPFAGAPASD